MIKSVVCKGNISISYEVDISEIIPNSQKFKYNFKFPIEPE